MQEKFPEQRDMNFRVESAYQVLSTTKRERKHTKNYIPVTF